MAGSNQAIFYKQYTTTGGEITTDTIKHPLKDNDEGIVTAALQVIPNSGTASFTVQIRYYYKYLRLLHGQDVFSDWFNLVDYKGKNQISNADTNGKVFISNISKQPEFDQCDGYQIKITRSSGSGFTVNLQIMGR